MLRVRDIMTAEVVTVAPTTSLRDAAELFARRHIGGAPVVDGQRVVGVVTTSDILAFAAAAPPPDSADEEDEDDWEPPAEDLGWDDGEDAAARFFAEQWVTSESDTVDYLQTSAGGRAAALDGHTVSEIMTGDVLALPPTADIMLAAEKMRSADVHRLLVVENGALCGILSTTDLARAVADRRITTRTYVFDRRR